MKQPLTALIVDDASQARKLLRLMLAEHAPDVQVLGEAGNVTDAVKLLKANQPDVVFLDIEMPGRSGLQLMDELGKGAWNFDIVFTTAYSQYAIQAFRLAAVDYLLKPIDEKQLTEALHRVKEHRQKAEKQQKLQYALSNLDPESNPTISIPTAQGYTFVKVNDLQFVTADGSYAKLTITGQADLTVSKNLKYFEQVLEHLRQFMRVHRSYLINLKHVQRFDKSDRGIIIMTNGREIDLARDRRKTFLDAMVRFGQ